MHSPSLGGRAGVAFLAAGTIMFSRGEVQGLATGAGLWLTGAVGLSAGFGLWQIATFGTLLALAVLGLMYSVSSGIAPDNKGGVEGKAGRREQGHEHWDKIIDLAPAPERRFPAGRVSRELRRGLWYHPRRQNHVTQHRLGTPCDAPRRGSVIRRSPAAL